MRRIGLVSLAATVISLVEIMGQAPTGQTAGYRPTQTMGEGSLLNFFVEVTQPTKASFVLMDSDGPVAPRQDRGLSSNESWIGQVELSRSVRIGSTLVVSVTTDPRVGHRFGVSSEPFKVTSSDRRVHGTTAPIIREPIGCTSTTCDVCYTLDENAKLVFDSYSENRTLVKSDFDPKAPAVRGTHTARWVWGVDVKQGLFYVVARSDTDGSGAESSLFKLPPGPPPAKCP